MEMNTVSIERIKAKLSCNHTEDVPAGQPVGARVECDKCPALKSGEQPTRRIKKFVGQATTQPEPTAAREVEAAEDRIAELVEKARTAPKADEVPEGVEPGTPPAQVISLHGGPVQAPAEAETSEDYDRDKARDEWNAIKAWRANGEQGEAPATPNLDAMNKAHAAGRPRKKAKKSKGTSRPTSVLSPKVKAARDSGKRGKGTPMTADELVDYVVKQRRQYPEETSYNLKEYSWWVEGNAHGLKRWNDAWDAASVKMEEDAKA
jgi:hypothetical protein